MITAADLKVGDKVGVCSGGWEHRAELKTVARRTATQVILDDHSRWTLRGKRVGEASSYHGSWLITVEDANELIASQRVKDERASFMRVIEDADYRSMTTVALREISGAVKRHEPQPSRKEPRP